MKIRAGTAWGFYYAGCVAAWLVRLGAPVYPVYNVLMLWSSSVQGRRDDRGPWKNVKRDVE